MAFISLLTLAFLLAGTELARADPISTAILTFIGIGATGTAVAVTTFILNIAAAVGLGLLAKALKKPQATRDPGVQFDVEVGDDAPIGFVVGTGVTAGTRKYIGTWGTAGKTPNAYLTDVIQVGDIPAPGQPGLWVKREKVTILWGDAPVDQGYPISEFRVAGKDYAWVKYRDGTETTADAFLLDKFGSDADRPWLSTMIGRGCPHLIITALVNRELFPGQMEWLVEPPQTPWYDVRLDTTAGGSGSHRWDNQATWETTNNPVVIAYNIIRGVTYGDEWVFGGQSLPSFRLPDANWMAAANECDVLIGLVGGGTEKQFRCGMEVRGDMEPLAVIEELLKACSGRLAEVGGIFKVLVGAPPAAVYAFTDDDIVITKGQSLTPFPGLDDTHNALEANYPEPAEMWASKNITLYSDTLEEEDGDRRLPISVSFPAVPFGVQAQRLTKAMLDEERRFRGHGFFLPPEAWILEPGVDVVSWTSARNGYTNKKFLLGRIVGERTMNQLVVLKEIDPADYDWVPATDEQPTSTGFLGPIRPPAQAMTGWTVEPYTFLDAAGNGRRPGIKVGFTGELDDVRAVRVVIRLAATLAIVFDGESPYDITDLSPEVIPQGTFLRATAYQARGRFLPISDRPTDWSAWLDVTTPDVGLGAAELNAELDALLNQLRPGESAWLAGQLDLLKDTIEALAAANSGIYAVAAEQLNAVVSVIGQRVDENEAQIVTAQSAVAETEFALAQFFLGLSAVNAQGEAEAQFQIAAGALPEGAAALVEFLIRAGVDGQMATAALRMAAYASGESALSRVQIEADQIDVIGSNGALLPLLMVPIAGEPLEAPVVAGNVQIDLSGRLLEHWTDLTANATMIAPLGATLGFRYGQTVYQHPSAAKTLAFNSDIYLLPHPTISDTPGAIIDLEYKVKSVNPLLVRVALDGDPYTLTPTIVFRDHVETHGGGNFGTFNFSALDFVPGNLLLILAASHRQSTGEGSVGSTADADLGGSGWNSIVSAGLAFGTVSEYHRLRAFWKIADGTESTVQPFVFAATSVGINGRAYHALSFNVLGGSVALGAGSVAQAVFGTTNITAQAPDLTGVAPPLLSVAFASRGLANPPPQTHPDQTFSETPGVNESADGDLTDNGSSGGTFSIASRVKIKNWPSSPPTVSTVTADLVTTGMGATVGSGLLSFNLRLE